ncbi:MAG: hypothetical protein Q8P82_01010 [bacterium]|nr:hypothetical protein [bacterium]
MKRSSFIMLDGIDGSGKTTMLKIFASALAGQDQVVFDLPAWCKEHHRLPTLAECGQPDLLISAEPTQAWIGAAIRQELIRTGTGYTPRTIAEAFALDRMMLYERLLIPLRRAGTIIVQDRGVATSLVYQASEQTGLSLEEVVALPGNALALRHAPDVLIIADCRPETAITRLAGRNEKNDDSHFEQTEFLRIHAERFRAPWFRELWQTQGTQLIYLDANRPAEEVQRECISIANSLITHA